MNRHQKRPFAGRSQRPPPTTPRGEPQGFHNARRSYDRYMALAQAELQAGDRIAAENYYQHAEQAAGKAVRGIQPSRCHDRSALWRHGARPCPRMMGGDVTVASEAGKGSVFTVRLPV